MYVCMYVCILKSHLESAYSYVLFAFINDSIV